LPKEMLSFEWNAPPSFGPLRDKRTQVIIQFDEVKPGNVKVDFAQLGWGKGEKWDELYDYFDRAWSSVLGNLKKRFTEGPPSRE
ncbi:MAG: SRPBCC domain-containing protein, partial [Candidatus Zixiibacteriota bacterium]